MHRAEHPRSRGGDEVADAERHRRQRGHRRRVAAALDQVPALDPTAMGWSQRDWYLGPHKEALFDRSGNVGPTIWWNGRIVGGWAQRRSGEIVVRLPPPSSAQGRVVEAANGGALDDAMSRREVEMLAVGLYAHACNSLAIEYRFSDARAFVNDDAIVPSRSQQDLVHHRATQSECSASADKPRARNGHVMSLARVKNSFIK